MIKINKIEILKKFKALNSIKKTIIDYRTNKEIFEGFKQHCLNTFTTKDGKKITEEDFNKNYTEDNKSFNFSTCFIFKNNSEKSEIIKNLTYDIKTTSIKEYDKINGNWFKTNFAIYEKVVI